jgi:hypothetical protein
MRRMFQRGNASDKQLYRCLDRSDGRDLDPPGTESCMGISQPQLHARRPTLGILWRNHANCWSL